MNPEIQVQGGRVDNHECDAGGAAHLILNDPMKCKVQGSFREMVERDRSGLGLRGLTR
jgi:hypothetical protein